jgi:NAD(P)-dependent dehydrogenase (short-subunit alcohol dehydrogenase family)
MTSGRFSLEGRRAFVTGASSGIGRAIALGLFEQGAQVVVHHFGDPAGAADVAKAAGGAAVVEADFTRDGAAAALAADVLANHGPIDILVANAAIERRVPWQEASAPHVMAHVNANFLSLLALAQHLVPPMAARGWGRVVATGSVMAERPRAETIAYAAMKAAQLTAVRALAREVSASGVTMNVVSPGAIEVEQNATRYADPAFRRAVTAKIPAGRAGSPEDLVGPVLFLCSDAAAYVTGADLPVNGGWTIGDAPGALPAEDKTFANG